MSGLDDAELPAGWTVAPLGEIAETTLGKMLDKTKSTGQHMVPYLRNINVQWGRINQEDVFTMDISPAEQDFFAVRADDLLVCEGGEFGRCAIWTGGSKYMAFQKALHRVRPSAAVTVRYLRYFLEYLSTSRMLADFTTGSTIKHLPQERLREIPVALPPLAEQHRIVEALEDRLSRLDAATRLVMTVERRLSTLRTSILTSTLREGALPPGWTSSTIGELAAVGTGATPPKSRTDYYEGGTVPWVTSSLLNSPTISTSDKYVTELALQETSIKVYPAGTILVAMYGEGKTRGLSAELTFSAAINQACAAITIHSENISRKEWIKLVLESQYHKLRRLSAGGVQPNLNLGLIRNISIPLPPLKEQESALSNLEAWSMGMSHLRTTLARLQARATHLRHAIVSQAFSGKLVAQNPADEPASVLLDRIRAERAAQGGAAKRVSRRPRKSTTSRDVPPPPASSTPVPIYAVQQELPL